MKPFAPILLACGFFLPHACAGTRSAFSRHRGRSHPELKQIGSESTYQRRLAPSERKVIIQMFQWDYPSVAAECENFLGEAGYGYVEVGNAVEHVTGPWWWTSYQPVSYKLISKYGDADAFEDMTRRCAAVGVGVLVDVIVNHMTGTLGPNTGIAGTNYSQYNYPPVYNYTNFHHCGTLWDDIVDWTNQTQMWNCELVNLADLATETPYVQKTLADYLNSLLNLGAAGFRVDAGTLVDPKDLAKVYDLLNRPAYIQHEAPGAPNYLDIAKNGDFQEFRMCDLLNVFRADDLTALMTVSDALPGWCPSDSAVVFTTNHDRERGGLGWLNFLVPQLSLLANVYLLGWNYGTPEILSSYAYVTRDDGGPNGGYGTCDGDKGANGWYCQHRFPAIVGMVGFWNEVRGTNVNSGVVGLTKAQIAWGRGTLGFVAINNADVAWPASFTTLLPDGHYCDILHGKKTQTDCPGLKFIVKAGVFSVTIPPRDAIALRVGSQYYPPVTMTFEITANTEFGETVWVSGNVPALGQWDASRAVQLWPTAYPNWSANVKDIPGNTVVNFKYFKRTGSGMTTWESMSDRNYMTASENVTLSQSWES